MVLRWISEEEKKNLLVTFCFGPHVVIYQIKIKAGSFIAQYGTECCWPLSA